MSGADFNQSRLGCETCALQPPLARHDGVGDSHGCSQGVSPLQRAIAGNRHEVAALLRSVGAVE